MTSAPARRLVSVVRRRIYSPVRTVLRDVTAWRSYSTVREACGLADTVPLLVHAGPTVDDRCLGAIVAALPRLATYHLAVVEAWTGADRAAVEALLRRAQEVGVGARVHRVIRPRRLTPEFLAAADLAVHGFCRPDGVSPLVPEVFDDYRAAGLKIVAGNARGVREYLVRHGAGEVFATGSLPSFATAVRRATTVADTASTGSTATTTVAPAPTAAPAGPSETPTPWTRLGTGPVRLGLGTANYAGQLAAIATAVCAARADVSAELVMAKPPSSFRYPADVYLHFPTEHHLDVQLDQIRRVLSGYTHLVVDAFRPVLGRINGDDISGDLPALARAGIKVALLAHGSEIRHPAEHLDRHAESGFRDAPEELRTRLTTVVERNRRIARESGLPLFVTTPDLLDDVPWATWAPLVVDVDGWACDRPVMERPRPVVLHAPSTRWTKGTDRILPDLQELHDRKVIDFRLVEGMPHDEMRRLVFEADIVAEQFVMGTYGTFACEAMAAGKLVVSYLSEKVHERVGIRPPIVSATSTNLVKTIESLIEDRGTAARLATGGPGFVREHHDGRRTAAAFDAFLR
ncbi:glycosyl transferase family 1 [Micromonospora echinospora]|uniref:glycosyl transferase family 1 n=1 Tax=Micromonospora echinospora TaxID=1877 RepID=UPI003A88E969